MPVISTTKMTARQYLQLGQDPPGVRLELVDGEIAVSPSPFPRHSYVAVRLSRILLNHIIARDLGLLMGDTDTLFGEYDVRRPDLIYFTKSRQHLVREDKVIDGAPDLCVEILSPSSGATDRKDKFKQYAAGGVNYFWIVDPAARTIEAFGKTGSKYKLVERGGKAETISLPPFTDLKIPLQELWFPASVE